MHHDFSRALRMWLNNYWSIGILRMESLDIGAHCTKIDVAVSDLDSITAGNLDNDALFVRILYVLVLVRAVDIDANLFDKRCGDDEEDQHDEDDIQHGSQVYLVFFLGFTAASNSV